jgi:chromosome segregation ATPase
MLAKMKIEISSLKEMNIQYRTTIEELNGEKAQMKIDFEKKIRSALEALKAESDKRISEANEQTRDWRNKYYDLEKLSKETTDKLKMEIKTLTKNFESKISDLEYEIETLKGQLKNMTTERDNALQRIKELNASLSEWKMKFQNLDRDHQDTIDKNEKLVRDLHADYKAKIASLEITIKSLNNQLRNMTDERDSLSSSLEKLNSQYNELKKKYEDSLKKNGDEISKLKNELKALAEELNGKIDHLTGNLKLTTTKLEGMTKERDQAREKIRQLEGELDNCQKLLNQTENSMKTMDKNYRVIVGERDGEIVMLISTISTMNAKWTSLTEAYDVVQAEIKKLLCCNEELRGLIRDLTSTNHAHNHYINDYEEEMKKVFEQFVRQALKKKTIEFNDPAETVNKCEESAKNTRQKLMKISNEKPSEGKVFMEFETTLKTIKGGKTTFPEMKLPRTEANLPK